MAYRMTPKIIHKIDYLLTKELELVYYDSERDFVACSTTITSLVGSIVPQLCIFSPNCGDVAYAKRLRHVQHFYLISVIVVYNWRRGELNLC